MFGMLRKLMGCVREYKKVSILTPILMIGEVVMECLIPFVVAELVNQIKAGCEFSVIVKHGLVLFAMACVCVRSISRHRVPELKPRRSASSRRREIIIVQTFPL